jgi:hypothetical protein
VLFDVHVEALMAALIVQGRGFAAARAIGDFDPGLGGGVSVGLLTRRRTPALWPFIGLSCAGWLRPQEAIVSGPATAATPLPRFDLYLSAGFSLGAKNL